MPLCHVSGCNVNIRRGDTGHRFPHRRDFELAKRWLVLCKIQFKSFNAFEFDGLYICGKHFSPDAYVEDVNPSTATTTTTNDPADATKPKPRKRPILKPDAIPTLYMPASASIPKHTRPVSVRRQLASNKRASLTFFTKL